MIKDTFFSMPRFMNLCCKDMVENLKTNVLRLVLLYGIMVVVMIWNGYFEYTHNHSNVNTDPAEVFLLVVFAWALWGFGCLSASFTMEKMKSKTSRLSLLMTPATPFEKYFSRWLVCTIFFLVVFLVSYKLADYTRVLVLSLIYPELTCIVPVDLSHVVGNGDYYSLCRTNLDLQAILAAYCFFQSCFVLGSSIWPKNSFLKTFAAGVVIAIVYSIVIGSFAKILSFNDLRFSSVFDRDLLSKELVYGASIYIFLIFALFNWTLAYFRFKESEIINRL